jgi:DNA-binding NarL/FixJ family response regulator
MERRGRILVVEHDEATRVVVSAVARRLGFTAQAVENAELARAALDERPVLAVLEVDLPGATSGLELMRELHLAHGDSLPVILVSGDSTAPVDRVAGLLSGADDYMSKPVDENELLARILRSLGRSISAVTNGNTRPQNGATQLSPREREILTLMSSGMGQLEIASDLVVSPKTVGTHIQHILTKLGVHSRAQAVAEAYRRGLVQPDFEGHRMTASQRPEPGAESRGGGRSRPLAAVR